eukprot:1315716-Amorphochlora_amoeboformis.AAC.1
MKGRTDRTSTKTFHLGEESEHTEHSQTSVSDLSLAVATDLIVRDLPEKKFNRRMSGYHTLGPSREYGEWVQLNNLPD